MVRRILGLLPLALGLLATACADQTSFEPTSTSDAELVASKRTVEVQGKGKSPGGSVGGLKKDRNQ